jgi:hypothetical protein
MAEISVKEIEKEKKKNKTKTISIAFEEKSLDATESHKKTKFHVKTVSFVAKKLKEFLKKKGWFAVPKLRKTGGNLKTTSEYRCSMRDLVEDFRFYLRQYFAENCEKEMPAFYYTTQTALFQMASSLGFRVVKPQNKLILQYHSF